TSLCDRASTGSATANSPSPTKAAICDRYTGAERSTMGALRQIAGLRHPAPQVVGAEHFERALPATHVVASEVELDPRDSGLDGSPKRPADVGHEREQVHPRQLSCIRSAEVGLAQRCPQVLVERRLLCRVAKVEARVVVAAQLVVDDPQRGPVVD